MAEFNSIWTQNSYTYVANHEGNKAQQRVQVMVDNERLGWWSARMVVLKPKCTPWQPATYIHISTPYGLFVNKKFLQEEYWKMYTIDIQDCLTE